MNRTARAALLCSAIILGSANTAALCDESPAQRTERSRRLAGQITKIDNGNLTVSIRNRSAERSVDLKLDENVRVTVESPDKVQVVGEGGNVLELPKAVPGKVSDLKVGQRVMVTTTFGGTVTEIAASNAREGEGEGGRAAREGDAPRVARADGERPRGDAPRDGERPKIEGARDGERPKAEGARDGERPKVEGARDGERPKVEGARDGERPRGDAPRDGERPKAEGARDGEPPAARPMREHRKLGRNDLVSGDIATVSGDSLTVNAAGERGVATAAKRVIKVSPDARIILEGNPAKLSDLQPGMPVTITMQNDQAVRVEVPIDLSKPKK